MDPIIYILIIGLVGIVTFGSVFLLFTEMFQSRHRQEGHTAKRSPAPLSDVTKEERVSLTGSQPEASLLRRIFSSARKRDPLTAPPGTNDDKQRPSGTARH